MTSTTVPLNKLPPTAPFLNSVCPGFTTLDDNVHYTLNDSDISLKNQEFLWPFSESATDTHTAQLNKTYLNISRPPISKNESNTYVSLPNHITSLFKSVVRNNDKGMEGNLHIGANINPLSHDPFRIVNLNPGCITKIIPLHNHTDDKLKQHQQQDKTKNNPFNKLTTNFNRLLNFGNDRKGANDRLFHKLLDKPNKLIQKVSQSEDFIQQLRSDQADKLLVSSHVNVLNVFALSPSSTFTNTKKVVGEKPPLFTSQELRSEDANEQQKAAAFAATEIVPRVIQEPLLRVQFNKSALITSMTTFVKFDKEPTIVCGFESGELIMIRLSDLTYSVFDDFGFEQETPSPFTPNVAVTSLEIIHHVNYDCLIVAGFSNGEVVIVDPYPRVPSANDEVPPTNATFMTTSSSEEKIKKSASATTGSYRKTEIGSDSYITYFKKFDLSPINKLNFEKLNQSQGYPVYLLGHFKISHKPITAISSTLEYSKSINLAKPETQPMILAIAANDGFVRFIDFVFTYNLDFGDETNKNNHSIVTDIISNYFNDGITDVQFSPDFKFVCVVGKGDLIETFKMSYYNVNGLLAKNTGTSNHVSTTNVASTANPVAGRRSRSGTINSLSSGGQIANPMFLSAAYHPYNTSSVASVDASRNENSPTPRLINFPLKEVYPPMIKDIQIVGRFKGHTNTVKAIQFIKSDDSSNNSVYKLISCGYDGKTIFWEFDYKALPKVKKPKEKPSQQPITRRRSLYKKHVIGPRVTDQLEIIVSIYKSLFDVRLKRHYRNIYKKSGNHPRHAAIISPIVNDKLVPSIEIPLASVDLSGIVYDGKIDGFYIDQYTFWVFAKNGDLFTYTIV
ncbi:uncharacterized protein SPAPADRAFT_149728 [Spathaspora passalidarum NRRL Y-27907]|uniref:Uncharacterized protein n=1 Tax=Spathaspora passalidarum (strain NRRL Y-27907 / 11-Y1) TaxID=619300 RepID=G3AJE3_SPAPN|nr:uncharacterized protein SPAPADRAFT_149728 [Spathaspora passalidarum NRRL Y-27907]EGW34602.1 hypothetical protein SPAPADRAFT_149728 [Spathaspora passalidarum NRRL Y-27907]